MITLKDAYADYIESERFFEIVKKNLENYPSHMGGAFSITNIRYCALYPSNDNLYWYPLEEGENFKGIKILGFNIKFDIKCDVFGVKFLDTNEISLKLWLMNDNYVFLWLKKTGIGQEINLYEVVELSEFIKKLKNPINILK